MAHRAVVRGRRLRQARERKEREEKVTSVVPSENNVKSEALKKRVGRGKK